MRTHPRRAITASLPVAGVVCAAVVGLTACTTGSGSSAPATAPSTLDAAPATSESAGAAAGASTGSEQSQSAESGQGDVRDPSDTALVPGTDPTPPARDVLRPLAVDPAGGPVQNACDLLTPGEPLLASEVARTSENRTSPEFSVSTCVWGAQDSEAILWLYVIEPGTVADPGSYFIPQQAPPSSPAPQPPGGRVWEAGFFGFGASTVEGRTYAWSAGENQVVLSYLGTVTPDREPVLLAAAREIDQRLI